MAICSYVLLSKKYFHTEHTEYTEFCFAWSAKREIHKTIFYYWCPVKFWEVTVWTKGRGPTAWKANKHPAQGNALGLWMFGFAPWRGKSIAVQTLIIAFALSGRKSRLQQHPGRCPGLMALSPFRGIIQAVGLIPFKHLYIHRVRGVYRTAIIYYIEAIIFYCHSFTCT